MSDDLYLFATAMSYKTSRVAGGVSLFAETLADAVVATGVLVHQGYHEGDPKVTACKAIRAATACDVILDLSIALRYFAGDSNMHLCDFRWGEALLPPFGFDVLIADMEKIRAHAGRVSGRVDGLKRVLKHVVGTEKLDAERDAKVVRTMITIMTAPGAQEGKASLLSDLSGLLRIVGRFNTALSAMADELRVLAAAD